MNKMQHNRLQLLLDAKTLGIIARNLAAMPNQDAEATRKVYAIKNKILARYNANSITACMLRIQMWLRANP